MERLRPGKNNPRTDPGDIAALTEMIRRQGLKQPILAVPIPGSEDFEIEDGWRRWLAMKDWSSAIPAVVVPYQQAENTSVRAVFTALVTDVGKKSLNQIERAKGFQRLQKEFGYNASEIARQVGLSGSTVSNALMLLELAPDTQQMVEKGDLSPTEVGKMLRRYRAKQRKKLGMKPVAPQWEEPWFTAKHPLGKKAEQLCDSRDHNMRRRYGAKGKYRGACGQCWQSCVEQDYELVLRAAGWTAPSSRSNLH